ncbi:hypothetical protein [Bradyrhizobium sp. SYSU BS000235]|uniref:hypothetical protein n=1 Tax=Bradyrhizobium sp. SYSU BS000235 TaxID=3411332 RepID=UPI003C7643C3
MITRDLSGFSSSHDHRLFVWPESRKAQFLFAGVLDVIPHRKRDEADITRAIVERPCLA